MTTTARNWIDAPEPNDIGGDGPEATIRRWLWHFPSLYKSRTDVVYGLLYGHNNHVRWHKGALVEPRNSGFLDFPSEVVFPDPKGEPGKFADLRANRDRAYETVRSDLERAATTWAEPSFALYADDDAAITKVPARVRPDWAALIAEAERRMPAFLAREASA